MVLVSSISRTANSKIDRPEKIADFFLSGHFPSIFPKMLVIAALSKWSYGGAADRQDSRLAETTEERTSR
jgi:hypothetical protein